MKTIPRGSKYGKNVDRCHGNLETDIGSVHTYLVVLWMVGGCSGDHQVGRDLASVCKYLALLWANAVTD